MRPQPLVGEGIFRGAIIMPTLLGNAINCSMDPGDLEVVPLLVREPLILLQLGLRVVTLGAASVIHIALFDDDGAGYPARQYAYFGSVSGASTGLKLLLSGVVIEPGLWWLGTLNLGTVVVVRGVQAGQSPFVANVAGTSLGAGVCGYQYFGLTAMPAVLPPTFGDTSSNTPKTYLKTAP